MSTRTPFSTAFCLLVMTSCLFNNFLLATPLVKRSEKFVETTDTRLHGQREYIPNLDEQLQSEIYQKCRSLAYDDLPAGLDWRDTDPEKQFNKYSVLSKKKPSILQSEQLFTGSSSENNIPTLPPKFNRNDVFNFVEKNKQVEAGLHSLEDESLTKAQDHFHQLCYLALNGLIGDVSPKSKWNRDKDQSERDAASGRNRDSDLLHSNRQGNTGNDPYFGRKLLDKRNDQSQGKEHRQISTILKRRMSHDKWLDLAQNMVKRRRVRLSINNALMTLTDMLVAHQARRILRQRSVLRERLIAAG